MPADRSATVVLLFSRTGLVYKQVEIERGYGLMNRLRYELASESKDLPQAAP